MEEIIPWDEWVEFVRPYYPAGKRGRPTKGIEKMLRMYLLQTWFNLSIEELQELLEIKHTRAYNLYKSMEADGFIKVCGRGSEKKIS